MLGLAIPSFLLLFFPILLLLLINLATAFCPPGCECHDDTLSVSCDFPGLNSIPILLNPMLKSLTIRNSNGLKLDTFSIALYQDLELLDLSNDQIVHIPAGFFAQLTRLKRLNLRGNKLKRVEPKTFAKIPTLESLDMSSNQIDRCLPDAFQTLPKLQFLNLSSNQLFTLPPAVFSGLHDLRVLRLDRNRLAKMPAPEVFNETGGLEELHLAGNIISELPSNAFSALRKLNRLDLSSNLISRIQPDAFAGLDELEELNLSRNLLSNWAGTDAENSAEAPSLANLPVSLKRLDLSGNAWTMIPSNAFDGRLQALKELSMEEMSQLTEIQANAFANLASLERLSLANSAFLSTLHPTAFGRRQPMLRHLDLSNCHLETLAPELLYDWSALKTLKLAGNRWNCDCALLSLLAPILEAQRKAGHFVEDILCTGPEELRDQRIVAVPKQKDLLRMECMAESAASTFVREHFALLCSTLGLFMLASLGLLLCCLCCPRRSREKTTRFCYTKCLIRKEHNDVKKTKTTCCRDQSRTQLYATGSSYTESLIYEKAAGFAPPQLNRPQETFYNCGLANLMAAQKSPSTCCSAESTTAHNANRATTLTNSTMSKESSERAEEINEDCNVSGDDYYSSIGLDAFVGTGQQQRHRSPPESPPPPPPPIFSDPPSWPPPSLLASLPPCQMAAPPYQLRLHSGRRDLSSTRPPSMHAPQPPLRWTPNY